MGYSLVTSNYVKVCLSNLFLFISLYLVLPIIPFALEASGVTAIPNWSLLVYFMVGLVLGGPFHNYFIESYSRKKVCTLSYLGVVVPILLYIPSIHPIIYVSAALIQGFSFGIATASSITIAIDVTDTSKRNKGNIIYAWTGRLGMILAIPLGIILFIRMGFNMVAYASIASGLLGLCFVRMTKTPFRAPIGATKLSLDRFFLPSGWKLVALMITFSFLLGSIFPLFMDNIEQRAFYVHEHTLEFIVLPLAVFFSSALLSRLEIDALYNHKTVGLILLRLPILFIAAYLYFNFKSNTSINILLSLLVLNFLLAFVQGYFKKRIVANINKWQLTPVIRTEITSPILSGIICMGLAIIFLKHDLIMNDYTSYRVIYQLLFFGIARVSSPILMLLIVSSRHCERSTANTSHILAWEVGMAAGCATTLAFQLNEKDIITNGLILLLLATVLHSLIHLDLIKKKKQHILLMKEKQL